MTSNVVNRKIPQLNVSLSVSKLLTINMKKPNKKKYGNANFSSNISFSVLLFSNFVSSPRRIFLVCQKKNVWQINAYKHAGSIIAEKNLGRSTAVELAKTINARLGGIREIKIN
jgi:hypothetical protein